MKFSGYKVTTVTVCIAVLTLAACSSNSSAASKVNDVDVATLQKKLQARSKQRPDKAVLIDVRTLDEHRDGHIPQTDFNVDWFNWDAAFPAIKPKLQSDTEIIVYCKSGGRSSRAATWFIEQGYKNVTNLLGGFTAWRDAGLKVEK